MLGGVAGSGSGVCKLEALGFAGPSSRPSIICCHSVHVWSMTVVNIKTQVEEYGEESVLDFKGFHIWRDVDSFLPKNALRPCLHVPDIGMISLVRYYRTLI
jgi:hypothetical protein